jgi:alpha/beta superfamily hydrolase
MVHLEKLPLITSAGKPLVHKFYRQEQEPSGLLVALPGNHYGMDGPLLYYPCKVLQDSGWDTLALTYSYQSAGSEFSPEDLPGLVRECQDAIRLIRSKQEYEHIAVIGKSLGAFIIAQLCGIEETLESARCLYITPPLGTPIFGQMLQESSQPAHIAIGTKDRFYDVQALEGLQAKRSFGLTLIENADHSMDVAGDLIASIEAVRRVTQEGTAFILAVE